MSKVLLFSLFFLFSVFMSSVSQIMLKKSTLKEHKSKLKEYLNPMVISAYVIFFSCTLITMFAYRYVPLSMGPILESTGYVFISILGFTLLKEKISKKKLIGMGIIVIGVIIFSL